MGISKQIKTTNATAFNVAQFPGGSRPSYDCANPFITRGVTTAPSTYSECINNPLFGTSVQSIVTAIGGLPSWQGPPAITGEPETINSTTIGEESPECALIETELGAEWKGCFWSASDSVLSCDCPDIGEKYPDYLKLRLNVASFWNTPAETPILRKRFLDSVTYGPQITFVVAGDFSIKPGNVVEVYADSISGYSTNITDSSVSKKYYVVSVKNTVTNSGVHETAIVGVEVLY